MKHIIRGLTLALLLPAFANAQQVHVDPPDAPMGTAAIMFVEVGCGGQTRYTPAAQDLVIVYHYGSSMPCGAERLWTGLWGYNAVLHSKGRDIGLSGIEIDIQNETAPASTIPFAVWGGYSKTGITAVLGPSKFDSTAAFASSVNYPREWGDHRWTYGYSAGGIRLSAFHSSRHTNQNGWMDPEADYTADTNSVAFLWSKGNPAHYFRSGGWNVRPGHMQMASGAFGPGWGDLIEVGRNLSGPCGAAGAIVLNDVHGGLHMLWVDAKGNLRINTHAPTADCAIPDNAGRVIQ